MNNILTKTYSSFPLLIKRRIEKGDKGWEGSLIYLTFSKMSYEDWVQKGGEFWYMLLEQEFKLNSLSTYQPFLTPVQYKYFLLLYFSLGKNCPEVFIQNRSLDIILDFSFSTP